jgi:hypothetical protein
VGLVCFGFVSERIPRQLLLVVGLGQPTAGDAALRTVAAGRDAARRTRGRRRRRKRAFVAGHACTRLENVFQQLATAFLVRISGKD